MHFAVVQDFFDKQIKRYGYQAGDNRAENPRPADVGKRVHICRVIRIHIPADNATDNCLRDRYAYPHPKHKHYCKR